MAADPAALPADLPARIAFALGVTPEALVPLLARLREAGLEVVRIAEAHGGPRPMNLLAAQLTEDEGRRLRLYTDTRGQVTVGVGHNLSDNGISNAICNALLAEDMALAAAAVAERWPWSGALPDAQWCVLINLAFNVGAQSLAGFVHFLAAMQDSDWQWAARELEASRWFGEVGERGPRMIARLTGVAP
jgi:lysozyme